MRRAVGAMVAAMTLGWLSSTAWAGPLAQTLELQVQESWQTSSTVTVKGKKTTVLTDHGASSGIIIDTAHTGRVEFETPSGQSFGTFSSLSAIGLGYPLIGASLNDEVDLSSQTAAAKVSGVVPGSVALTLLLTETGLTTSLGTLPFDAGIGGTIGNGIALKYQTYVDPNDHPFGEAKLLTTDAFPSSGPFAWGGSANSLLKDQFSMTEAVTITVPASAAAAATSFDASLSTTAVPEPGTAMMLGLPLGLISVLMARRKPNATAKPAAL